MSVEDVHTEYRPDYYVVTAWNGTGTALVFSTLEAYQKMIDEYEPFRVAFALPWVNGRPAVNGDHVLLMFELGLRPWTISISQSGEVLNVKSKPLHHVKLEVICERYKTNQPRTLEIWAESELHAKIYALDIMIPTRLAPEDSMLNDVDFGWKDMDPDELSALLEEEIAKPAGKKNAFKTKAKAKTEQAPAGPTIPGFGPTINLSDLNDA